MAAPYYPPGVSMGAYPQDVSGMQYYNPPSYPPYPILLGSGTLPESVAYWHNSPLQQPGMAPISGPALSQKQSAHSAPDQRKHKRTRSGCFTCRSRRVKCDEVRPICERCRKGKRDCVYPSPTAKSTSRAHSKSRDSRQSAQDSGSSDNEAPDVHGLEVIPDDDESTEPLTVTSPMTSTIRTGSAISRRQSVQSLGKRRARKASDTSLASKTKSESPKADWTSKSQPQTPENEQYNNQSQQPRRNIANIPGVARLRDDIRFFLNHHQEKLNHHHYFLRKESDDFVRGSIMDLALEYEPLLYAVVGFSAYHHTLRKANGKLYDFLKYYDRSLTLLRKSLGARDRYSEAMLVTILQLSTFEECIGDWVNLVDHHQAAHTLMYELLTPQSILTNELHRHIFIWYARFDVVAGLVAGNETILSREWHTSIEAHDTKQAASHPRDVQKQLSLVSSRLRLFAMDMASLYAKLSHGLIAMDQFVLQIGPLSHVVEDMRQILLRFDDSEYAIKSRPPIQSPGADDVLDTFMPGRFYQGPLRSVNFAWIDFLATELMFKYQSHLVLQQPEGAELQRLALEVCHICESIMRWPEMEMGTVIAFHNCLPITGMFLPRDHKHTMWSRRMLARLEQNGYIYPPKLRAGMADVWQLPEVNHWWLPEDDGFPEIVQEIRTLTEERTNNPRDNFREDIRDMKSLFSKINIDDTGSQNSSPSVDSTLLTESSPDQSWQQNRYPSEEGSTTWQSGGTK